MSAYFTADMSDLGTAVKSYVQTRKLLPDD